MKSFFFFLVVQLLTSYIRFGFVLLFSIFLYGFVHQDFFGWFIILCGEVKSFFPEFLCFSWVFISIERLLSFLNCLCYNCLLLRFFFDMFIAEYSVARVHVAIARAKQYSNSKICPSIRLSVHLSVCLYYELNLFFCHKTFVAAASQICFMQIHVIGFCFVHTTVCGMKRLLLHLTFLQFYFLYAVVLYSYDFFFYDFFLFIFFLYNFCLVLQFNENLFIFISCHSPQFLFLLLLFTFASFKPELHLIFQ